jgi:hypothetical protein
MAYPPISNLPTPPSRQDPANFSGDADSFLGALPTFQTEVNAAGDYIDSKATAAAASADTAQVAADSAVAAGNATAWVSGAAYAEGDSVWSLVNYQTYRAITDHSGETVDPSLDATNWTVLGNPRVTQTRDSFTSTAGQTSFTTGGYTPQFLDVYLNGVYLQDGTDYTATNGADVILTVGAALDDVLQVVAYRAFDAANVTGAANFTATGIVTAAQFVGGNISAPKNHTINGGFDVWQRGTSQTSSNYGSDDRWLNVNLGSTKVASQQTFTLGQTDVAGNPKYYSRTVVTSVADAANYALKRQNIEGVTTFSGETVTLTFWAKADANKNLAVEFYQNFGTGGSPSGLVFLPAQTVSLTSGWVKHSLTFDIPSVSGKTFGTGGNDSLSFHFWFEAGSDYDARTNSLGQQSGTFDIARVSVCKGDVTALDDLFEERSIGQELALCQRFYQVGRFSCYSAGATQMAVYQSYIQEMRSAPTVTRTGNAASSGEIGTVISNSNTNSFFAFNASTHVGGTYNLDAEL